MQVNVRSRPERPRATLPGPSRRVTVEPVEVPVIEPREEPAEPRPVEPEPDREPAPAS